MAVVIHVCINAYLGKPPLHPQHVRSCGHQQEGGHSPPTVAQYPHTLRHPVG